MPIKKTSFGPVAIVLRGGGSKGHDPRTIGAGTDVGLDIQVPVTQTANVFQISQPDGTVVYAIPAAGGTALTAAGAIPLVGGTYTITLASAGAFTLAAPTAAQAGMQITVISSTAFAHTITATGLLLTGSASVNVATYAAFAGARVTFTATAGGKWLTSGAQGVTFS